ncbi:MAG TPA: MarR family transcriptional regulator [Candidatus Methanofastidiosa archaeon]|nr:MarR family transcriptional regulator [Candidatus Methanofastidiosa archaeon]
MSTDITLRQGFAFIGFLSGFLIIALKLFMSSSIQIVIEGEQVSSHNLEGIFTFQDVAILLMASLLMGFALSYIVMSFRVPNRLEGASVESENGANAAEMVLEERKRSWESIALSLGEQEAMIYDLLISSDGIILQSDIVSALNISKSTVSRILDLLESRGLVEKRRRGMGNVIMLK